MKTNNRKYEKLPQDADRNYGSGVEDDQDENERRGGGGGGGGGGNGGGGAGVIGRASEKGLDGKAKSKSLEANGDDDGFMLVS